MNNKRLIVTVGKVNILSKYDVQRTYGMTSSCPE